jgi:3-phenylpropionate/cinnamic acid dioxygenase small subunit
MASPLEEKEAIRDLLQTAAWLLDTEAFTDWVELFVAEGNYEVHAYSTEIGVEMEWMNLTKDELSSMLEQVPEHLRDLAQRLHLVSSVKIDLADQEAHSLSSFAIFRTTPDGVSQSYAVGRYEDSLVKQDAAWRFLQRKVMLHTRVLEVASHLPF